MIPTSAALSFGTAAPFHRFNIISIIGVARQRRGSPRSIPVANLGGSMVPGHSPNLGWWFWSLGNTISRSALQLGFIDAVFSPCHLIHLRFPSSRSLHR